MIVVQSSPPVAGANSYASIQDFKSWMDSRLKVYAGKTDAQLEAALVSATEYLDNRFTFIGYRATKGQELEWPRQDAWDNRGDKVEGIPGNLVKALFEYAYRALNGVELNPDLERDASGQVVLSKSSAVGPISESVTYAASGAVKAPSFPSADAWLVKRGLIIQVKAGGLSTNNLGRS